MTNLANGHEQPAWAGGDGRLLVSTEMADAQRERVLDKGTAFAKEQTGIWLLIAGTFSDRVGDGRLAEDQVRDACRAALGYPEAGEDGPGRVVNVLLESEGGALDSAFRIVQYLSWYSNELNVYVPGRAKSASTLIALAAQRLYVSPFGELGPLDAQIPDPRNPANTISALDCYKGMDYVQRFGLATMREALNRLIVNTDGRVPLADLLVTASEFALGTITPLLSGVKGLDFGTWGRTLQIGEHYAEIVLQGMNYGDARARRIAQRLVYGYTHHPFPIGYGELVRIGLPARTLDKDVYAGAMRVLRECQGRSFIGFISQNERAEEERVRRENAERATADEEDRVSRRRPASAVAGIPDKSLSVDRPLPGSPPDTGTGDMS